MKKNIVLGAVAVVLLLVAGYLLFHERLFPPAPAVSSMDPAATAAAVSAVAPADQKVAPDNPIPGIRGAGRLPAARK